MSTPQRLYAGIRPGARLTDTHLPELRLPRDRALLPKCCPRCKGGLLEIDEHKGSTVPGRLVCVTCSEELAWLLVER